MKLSAFKTSAIISALAALSLTSCGNAHSSDQSPADTTVKTTDSTAASVPSATVDIKTDTASYTLNGKTFRSYIAYDQNRKGKLPIVVVMPEWWGLTNYSKNRAKKLAALGYFAIAADVFGKGDTATNPKEAMAFTKTYYTNPKLALAVVNSAEAKAASYPEADSSRVAAIGSCFGGYIVLNAAKMGAPLKAVVSFHGDLSGVQPVKGLFKGEILVCQGGDDHLVPEAAQAAFKKSMDSAGITYNFVVYPGAVHAFTNPDATALGEKFKMPIAYNAAADSSSWTAMKNLFSKTLN